MRVLDASDGQRKDRKVAGFFFATWQDALWKGQDVKTCWVLNRTLEITVLNLIFHRSGVCGSICEKCLLGVFLRREVKTLQGTI
mmetsp:Transcript_20370/g.29569  ORF Transcript_20370/g.29569 Transcript_20370/m.29569 type:complete len:84 (-) Transcript_20370:22-273(-)